MQNIRRALIVLFGLDDFLREQFEEGKRIGRSITIRRLIVELDGNRYKTLAGLRKHLVDIIEKIDSGI